MPLTFSKLIEKLGDENLLIQRLDDCTRKSKFVKHPKGDFCEITFGTNPTEKLLANKVCAFIVWVDREQLGKIVLAQRAADGVPNPVIDESQAAG